VSKEGTAKEKTDVDEIVPADDEASEDTQVIASDDSSSEIDSVFSNCTLPSTPEFTLEEDSVDDEIEAIDIEEPTTTTVIRSSFTVSATIAPGTYSGSDEDAWPCSGVVGQQVSRKQLALAGLTVVASVATLLF
jgi:hypothetical protein